MDKVKITFLVMKDIKIGDYVPVKVEAVKTDEFGMFPVTMESLIGSARNPQNLIGLPDWLSKSLRYAPSMNKVSEYLSDFCKGCDVECMNNIPGKITWKDGKLQKMAV